MTYLENKKGKFIERQKKFYWGKLKRVPVRKLRRNINGEGEKIRILRKKHLSQKCTIKEIQKDVA